MAHPQTRLDALAEQYSDADVSDSLERATYDDSVTTEPKETISIRLPASVLSKVRAVADARGTRTTALMREWVEECLARELAGEPPVTVAASELLAFIAEHGRVQPPRAS